MLYLYKWNIFIMQLGIIFTSGQWECICMYIFVCIYAHLYTYTFSYLFFLRQKYFKHFKNTFSSAFWSIYIDLLIPVEESRKCVHERRPTSHLCLLISLSYQFFNSSKYFFISSLTICSARQIDCSKFL